MEKVARVLRRELTIETVEQIDDLLTAAVRALRDAWENRDLAERNTRSGEDFVEQLLAGPDDAELSDRELALLEAYLRQRISLGQMQTEAERRNKLKLIRDFNRNLQDATGNADNTHQRSGPQSPADRAPNPGSSLAAESASDSPMQKKPKRSTERGEGRAKLIPALILHHQYDNGSCANFEYIGNNELARLAAVSPSTASEFFKEEFKGHHAYMMLCRDTGRLVAHLKHLNGEYSAHELFGRRPPGEDDRADDDE